MSDQRSAVNRLLSELADDKLRPASLADAVRELAGVNQDAHPDPDQNEDQDPDAESKGPKSRKGSK